MYIIFSNILENEGKNDTYLYLDMNFLFPFLNMGLTVENFSCDRNIPEAKGQIHMYAKGELIVFAHAINIFMRISSYPKALEHFRLLLFFQFLYEM
jgi:hypothetical protein